MAKYTNNVITEERFPSMGFRRWLLEECRHAFNSDDDLLKVKSLGIICAEYDDCSADSIKGIEFFPNLEELTLLKDYDDLLDKNGQLDNEWQQFDTIDLRQNKNLTYIHIESPSKRIYADGLPFLKYIRIECPLLEEFTFDTPQVESLILHQFQGITSIDGNKYRNLQHLSLDCCDNLTVITFKEPSDLRKLYCSYNDDLEQLDLSGCPRLTELDVHGSEKLTRVLLHPKVGNPTITTDLSQWQTLDIIMLPQDLITALGLPEEPNDYMLLHQTRKIKTNGNN
ncbi:MAG: hypothetical protein J6X70_03215 [Muribaculaceae bacterium]|nr:hypothetical protein [Muribaculaceae bacterium]